MFLLFMAKGLPAANILNAPFFAAEILNILVGSFVLVTVAPFPVLVAGILYRGGTEKMEAVPALAIRTASSRSTKTALCSSFSSDLTKV